MMNKLLPELNGELRVKLTEFMSIDSKNQKKCCREYCWRNLLIPKLKEIFQNFKSQIKTNKQSKYLLI